MVKKYITILAGENDAPAAGKQWEVLGGEFTHTNGTSTDAYLWTGEVPPGSLLLVGKVWAEFPTGTYPLAFFMDPTVTAVVYALTSPSMLRGITVQNPVRLSVTGGAGARVHLLVEETDIGKTVAKMVETQKTPDRMSGWQ